MLHLQLSYCLLTLVGTYVLGMFTLHFISMAASQTEASVVLLVELLLALFSGALHHLVSSIHHSASLFLPLIPSYAPYITEVPEVLNGVIFLQVGSDGLQAED